MRKYKKDIIYVQASEILTQRFEECYLLHWVCEKSINIMKIILPVIFSNIYDSRHKLYSLSFDSFIFQKDSLSLSSSDNICKQFRSRPGLHNTKNLIYIQTCSWMNFLVVFSLKNTAGGIMNNIRSKNLIDIRACKGFTFEAPAKYNK